MAAAGSCDHRGGRGEIPLLRAAVIDVGFIDADHVEPEAAEVERSHVDNAVVSTKLLVDRADDDAAVAVKQSPDILQRQNRVGNVRTDHKVSGVQTALGELAAHILDVSEECRAIFVRGVPLGVDGVGVVACRVVELHMQRLTLGLIVDVGLHRAGVVDHGLHGHPFLTASDADVHVSQIVTLQTGGTLCRGAVGVDGFTEAALAQIVQRQQTGRRDERRLVFVDRVAPAFHRNVTGAGGHERRHLAVTLAVFGQHLIRRKDVTVAGREVAIFEERLPRHDFFSNRHQDIGIKEVQFCTHS